MKKEPKITINMIDKNGRKHRLSSVPSKIKKFGNTSLVKRVKLGSFKRLCIAVIYGRDSEGVIKNEMECKTYEDLEWAYKSFTDKFLWV